jgi:hypothetical protein
MREMRVASKTCGAGVPKERFPLLYRYCRGKGALDFDEWERFVETWNKLGHPERAKHAARCRSRKTHEDVRTPYGTMCLRCCRYLPKD